jgi:hypothetical protein
MIVNLATFGFKESNIYETTEISNI